MEAELLDRQGVFGLAVVALHTCVQIEVRNYQLGGVLPHTDGGKWRVAVIQSEERLQRFIAENEEHTLTPEEIDQLRRSFPRSRMWSNLRGWVVLGVS